jgi:thymidylate synthase (FAD)
VSSTNQDRPETGPKLLASCARREEWSVFEMVSATFEIRTTRDIARQMLRHRSFSFQEFSQRYASVASAERAPTREARMKNPGDRQRPLPCSDWRVKDTWEDDQAHVFAVADSAYRWALNAGIAPEVARAVLPEGLTMTTLYMAGTIRSWIHYLKQRCAPETQLEHRLIAQDIREALVAELPEIAGVTYPPAATPEPAVVRTVDWRQTFVFSICSDDYLTDDYGHSYVCRRSDDPGDYDFRTRLTDESYGAGFVG